MATAKFQPGDTVYAKSGQIYTVKKSFLRDVNYYLLVYGDKCRYEREEELMTPSEYSDYLDQQTDDEIEDLENRLEYLEGL